jgi:hypothetical protein
MPTSELAATQNPTAEHVIHELYDLLELYGPSWYSEELRERIQAALGRSQYEHI